MVQHALLREGSGAPVPAFAWVTESRFGEWFLATEIWRKYVLEVAFESVADHIGPKQIRAARILDVGCGCGRAFPLLESRFHPEVIYGIDIDPAMADMAREEARRCVCRVEVEVSCADDLPYPEGALDLILCHQTIHHVSNQGKTLAEFYRVLRPGGVLLFCESLKAFICSPKVRLLFRHPNRAQRDADGYLEALRVAGFTFAPENVSMPDLWWARPGFGIYDQVRARLGLPRRQREPTQLNVAAFRPG